MTAESDLDVSSTYLVDVRGNSAYRCEINVDNDRVRRRRDDSELTGKKALTTDLMMPEISDKHQRR
jgi:hypothetical protein